MHIKGIKTVNNSNIKIIGLTGQSGAGKTTFCEAFARQGFKVIDCDRIARYAADNRDFLNELNIRFPEKLIGNDGLLNRAATAALIFSDNSKRGLYNSIIFPFIIYDVIRQIKTSDKKILLDAPTLFEAGLDIICDKIIAVAADKERCIERIMLRDGLSFKQALSRITSQNSLEFFQKHSDYTIQNNGSPDELRQIAEKLSGEMIG